MSYNLEKTCRTCFREDKNVTCFESAYISLDERSVLASDIVNLLVDLKVIDM